MTLHATLSGSVPNRIIYAKREKLENTWLVGTTLTV
jgi:hypothetical protein